VPGDISSYKNDRTLSSFLGRVNYSYLNRYLLTLSIRRDGSSVFGKDYKWGNFPSASVAWRINEESFMKGLDFLNNLKLRVGYGVTGNQQGLYPQNSQQLVAASGQTYFGGSQITNYAISQNGNADLKWETRAQTNIGLDFALFNSRISGSVDVYTATTSNLLFNYTVPQPPYPYGNIVANVGSLLNEGIDFNLNVKVVQTKDFNFSINGNLSLLKNKVESLSGSINGVPLNTNYVPWGTNSFLIVGQPVGTFNILQHLGKDASNAETVVDVNKDGIIDGGNTSPDRKIEGSALPTYTYAFSPVFTYKNFDLSMLFRGSGGNKIYNSVKASFSYFESIGKQNMLASAIPLGLFSSQYSSDLWLEDGSFLRFDNLTLGYRFNTKKLKYISNLRLSLTATNLALFTKYTGIDPELNVNGANGFGSDGGIYPRTSTVAVGLNVTLK
jgi:iron complex outermembrane receptor protein